MLPPPTQIPDRIFAITGDVANEWTRQILQLWETVAELERTSKFRQFCTARPFNKVNNYIGLYKAVYVAPVWDVRFGDSNSSTGSYSSNCFGPGIIGQQNDAQFEAYVINPFDWIAGVHTLNWSNTFSSSQLQYNSKIVTGEYIGHSQFSIDGTNVYKPIVLLSYDNPGYIPVSLTHVATGSYTAILANGERVGGGTNSTYPVENAYGNTNLSSGVVYFYDSGPKIYTFERQGLTATFTVDKFSLSGSGLSVERRTVTFTNGLLVSLSDPTTAVDLPTEDPCP